MVPNPAPGELHAGSRFQKRSEHARAGKPRRGRGTLALFLTVIIIAVIAFAAVTALAIARVSEHSARAAEQSQLFIEALQSDPESAGQYLDAARDEIAQTRDGLAQVPLPQLAVIPWVERNIAAVETLLNSVDGLLADEGDTLLSVADLVNLETGELREDFASPAQALNQADNIKDTVFAIPDAITHLKDARDKVGAINTDGLLSQVSTGVDDTYTALDEAYATVSPLAATAEDIKNSYDNSGEAAAIRLALQMLG